MSWLPDRVVLTRRIRADLDAPQPRASATPADEKGDSETHLIGARIRELSLRLDRFAVDQIRALNHVTEQIEALRGAVSAIEQRSVETCDIDGMLIGFPADEWRLIAYCRARGAPEPGVLTLFRRLLQPGMRVVDVGANVGIFTVAAGLAVGQKGRVFAFEPTPRTAEILQENVQLNGLLEQGTVEIRQVAIGRESGVAQFGIQFGNCGHNSLFGLDDVDEVIDTSVCTLDESVKDPIDLVKIDAEGADVAVLEGMTGHIARSAAIQIIIELAPELLEKSGSGADELFRRINALGLEWLLIAEPSGEPTRCSRELLAVHRSANLLLRRRSAL